MMRPFAFDGLSTSISKAAADRVERELQLQRDVFVSPYNQLSYKHGTSWLSRVGLNSNTYDEFRTMTAEATIKLTDILDHDVSVIQRHTQSLANEMGLQLTASLTEMAEANQSKALKRLRTPPRTLREYTEQLKESGYFPNRYGKPCPPTLLLSELSSATFATSNPTPEDHEELYRVTKSLEKEALRLEALRIQRFRHMP